MKTTMNIRNIANPRRTTLAHLEDADEQTTAAIATETAAAPQDSADLPAQTANPQRTVLVDMPSA